VIVENFLFEVSEALRIPVLVLAILALAISFAELGALAKELYERRLRSVTRLEAAIETTRAAIAAGDRAGAHRAMRAVAGNPAMADMMSAIVDDAIWPSTDDRIGKRMAEFQLLSMRRLERTRILVRMGPALGLMGTLIPLAPALVGLADGDVAELTENLRVAFSVTVAGLLVGALAFLVSLTRERLYAGDYSDVEYAASCLEPDVEMRPQYVHVPGADPAAA